MISARLIIVLITSAPDAGYGEITFTRLVNSYYSLTLHRINQNSSVTRNEMTKIERSAYSLTQASAFKIFKANSFINALSAQYNKRNRKGIAIFRDTFSYQDIIRSALMQRISNPVGHNWDKRYRMKR